MHVNRPGVFRLRSTDDDASRGDCLQAPDNHLDPAALTDICILRVDLTGMPRLADLLSCLFPKRNYHLSTVSGGWKKS